jgi:DNA-binding CsgD family transcriptional regulator
MLVLTREPVFITDGKGMILAWNEGCVRLLGREAREALGAPCHEVIAGRDPRGHGYCGPLCPIRECVQQGRPIGCVELVVGAVGDRAERLICTPLVVPWKAAGGHILVEVLQPVPDRPKKSRLDDGLAGVTTAGSGEKRGIGRDGFSCLTDREREVLELLAGGMSTSDIAARLFISTVTVRNHVQSILHKLDVHSRVEAVSLAWNRGAL